MATSTTEQDFFEIKENLKNYLRNEGQGSFADYDFEGSVMSTLLDVLAFNTHYNALTVNMAVNEMFLDTAQLRTNVVSHAKSLGYTPQSARAAKASVSLSGITAPLTQLTIPRGSKFTGSSEGINTNSNVHFITLDAYDSVSNEIGEINFDLVKLYSGKLLTKTFIADNSKQSYKIPNKFCDTTTLRVYVRSSITSTDRVSYKLADGIIDIGSNSKVYFLEETDDERFSIYFGDDLIGKKLDVNNVIEIEYLKTPEIETNNVQKFSLNSTIEGFKSPTASVISSSSGGTGIETINSIKVNAPFNYSAQNRAVTISDYRVLLEKLYSNSDTISVWGGEDHIPPEYGKVFICIKPESGEIISDLDKNQLKSDLNRYKVSGITIDFVDAEYLYLDLEIDFTYNSISTTNSVSELGDKIQKIVDDYNRDILTEFGGLYRNSNLTSLIDLSDKAIGSSRINHKVYKKAVTYIDTFESYKFKFGNAISNYHVDSNGTSIGTISSNKFKITGSNNIHYFKDDGKGNMHLYETIGSSSKIVGTAINHGTVDYNSGDIVLKSISISEIISDGVLLKMSVTLDHMDITPIQNNIIMIASSSIKGTDETGALSSSPASRATTTSIL